MKKLLFIILFPLALVTACSNTENKATNNESSNTSSTDEVESYEVLFNDLFLPGSGGVFRGVNFEDSREKITKLETSRNTITILNDTADYGITFTTDMGEKALNFADIEYTVDDLGMYGVTVETYAVDKETADAVLDLTLNHLEDLYGKGEEASDGFIEFISESEGVIYAVKEIDLEDSFGMQIYIDMY